MAIDTTPTGTPATGDPAATGATPPAAPATAAPAAPEPRTVVMPTAAIGKMKKEHEEKGAQRARLELAKAHGFDTVDAMDKFLKDKRAEAAPAPKPKDKPSGASGGGGQRRDPGAAPEGMTGKALEAFNREREKIVRENESLKRAAAHADKKWRRERKVVEHLETEKVVREAAIMAGVKDVDYAVHLFKRHTASLDATKQKEFDENKFFKDLRGSHPYIFGEVVAPATTGTAGNGAAPGAPGPAAAAGAIGANGTVDAMKMTPEQYRAHLAKRGLTLHG